MQATYMQEALKMANLSLLNDEIPVGAIIVDYKTNQILAASHNMVIAKHDPTAHAEINVIRQACKNKLSEFLGTCDIYVTLEPCAMCAQAISAARIRRVYFGAYDPKSGGVDHGAKIFSQITCHHKPEVYGGIMEQKCSDILKTFFAKKRC